MIRGRDACVCARGHARAIRVRGQGRLSRQRFRDDQPGLAIHPAHARWQRGGYPGDDRAAQHRQRADRGRACWAKSSGSRCIRLPRALQRCRRAPRADCRRCGCGQPFAVLVDYAHTDDALEKVLSALRPLTHGKVAGALRLRRRSRSHQAPAHGRRPPRALPTSSTSPATIRARKIPRDIIEQILAGFPNPPKKPVIVEPDRRAPSASPATTPSPATSFWSGRQGPRKLPDHRADSSIISTMWRKSNRSCKRSTGPAA